MPKLRQPQEHGDLYAHTSIQIPTQLTDRERELIRELAALRGHSGRKTDEENDKVTR
jgi:DnaJ-class molecular chaperone